MSNYAVEEFIDMLDTDNIINAIEHINYTRDDIYCKIITSEDFDIDTISKMKKYNCILLDCSYMDKY